MGDLDRPCLPLLLDGASGTELMKEGLPAGACVEKWASEHPAVIAKNAVNYARAGSDIIYAPTFLANEGSLAAHGLEKQAEALNKTIVAVIKEAVRSFPVKVAGNISSTGLMCEPFGDTEFTALLDIYTHQSNALMQAGADLLAIETMSSLHECRAAVIAACRTGLPVMLTMTVDSEGRTIWGDDILASMVTLQDMGISAFGLNCSEGPDSMLPLFERIAPYAKIPLIAKPNAGNPLLSPIQFSHKCEDLMRSGVTIIGGCCGTTPEHIAALRHMLDSFDITKAQPESVQYDILTASRNVYYLDGDLEYSEPVECSIDMADALLEAADSGKDAVLVRLHTPDDGYHFSLNAHMVDMPVAFVSESTEALESALLHYCGKALVVSTLCDLDRTLLEDISVHYGAIVL